MTTRKTAVPQGDLFAHAMAQFGDAVTTIAAEDDLRTNADIKADLENRKFVITQVDWKDGKYGEHAEVTVVTEDNEQMQFIANKTKSGIFTQLRQLQDKGVNAGILCPQGLLLSEYYYNKKTHHAANNPGDFTGDAADYTRTGTYYLSR